MSREPRWRVVWNATLYSSGTVTIDDDTGIIINPLLNPLNGPIFPSYFILVGADMTGDELNDVTIEWYGDSAGNGGAIGTTTFNQILVGTLTDLEAWPGDVTAWNAARDWVPMPPYHKILWDLTGVAPAHSMSFIIYCSYVIQI